MKSYDSWHRTAGPWPQTLSLCALFTHSGMGRIWTWSLLSKAIVAGFLFWLRSKYPLLLCCVWGAYWQLGLPLGLTNLIYIVFLCCTPYSFTVHLMFFSYNQHVSSITLLTLACDYLLYLQPFGASVIAESRPKVPLFTVRAFKQRQFILGSPDFQFLSLHFSGLWWVLHFATPTSFLALPVAGFTRSRRHSCKCFTRSA